MADITDITSGVQTGVDYKVTGNGVFDDIMETINTHIEAQFDADRIQSTDIANMYIGIIPSVLAESMKFVLQKDIEAKNLLLLDEQITNAQKQGLQTDAQTATAEKQALLVERQTKGFDDDAKQKLLKQALDSWSVAYSVAKDANAIPDSIKVNSIDSIMKNAMDNLNVAVTNDPIGEA